MTSPVSKYSIGDRVRFIRDSTDGGPQFGMKGEEGTIVEAFIWSTQERYIIRLDEKFWKTEGGSRHKRSGNFNPSVWGEDLEVATEDYVPTQEGDRDTDI